MKRKRLLIGALAALLLVVLAACGGGEQAPSQDEAQVAAGDPAAGEQAFNSYCIACHGPGGIGVDGLGKPLPPSEFVAGLNDAELLDFIKTGRPVSDPLNTTGVDMPPKGGNPALTDDQILDIIAYIRQLQEQ
jgi:mono/diheme cytochrome c family protein